VRPFRYTPEVESRKRGELARACALIDQGFIAKPQLEPLDERPQIASRAPSAPVFFDKRGPFA
jgi:hypothetical protein